MRFESRFTELLKNETSQDIAMVSVQPDLFSRTIKSAASEQGAARLKIISEIANALNCDAEALMFLFDDVPLNDNEAQTAFPTFRESYALEAAE